MEALPVKSALLIALLLPASAAADPYAADNPYAAPALQASDAVDPFAWTIAPPVLAPGGTGRLELKLTVPAGFVVYRDQVEVTVLQDGGLRFGKVDLPPGLTRKDPANASDQRELYDMDVVVWVPVTAAKKHPAGEPAQVELQVRHQGCKGGLCYAPTTLRRTVVVPVRGPAVGP